MESSVIRLTPDEAAEHARQKKKNKLPAKTIKRLAKKVRSIYVTHKMDASNRNEDDLRQQILDEHPDLKVLANKCPFIFYSLTAKDTEDAKVGVYFQMFDIQEKIDTGKLGEREGQRLIGECVFSYEKNVDRDNKT